MLPGLMSRATAFSILLEESRAYDEVLRLLAGHSTLARTLSAPHLGETPTWSHPARRGACAGSPKTFW
jgi:hypothetical protein